MNHITWDKDRAEGVTEASSMGWRPGDWPAGFVLGGVMYSMRTIERWANAPCDVVCVRYVSPDGTRIKVLND